LKLISIFIFQNWKFKANDPQKEENTRLNLIYWKVIVLMIP